MHTKKFASPDEPLLFCQGDRDTRVDWQDTQDGGNYVAFRTQIRHA